MLGVAAKRGGEQPEANCRSVGKRTRFGGVLAASLLGEGEAWNSSATLEWRQKRWSSAQRGWGRNDGKVERRKRGDLHRR